MTPAKSVKAPVAGPQLVAVISSRGDLDRAARLRRIPDYFELRLDALREHVAGLESAKFGAPLIITARDPDEGGAAALSAAERSDLLMRFLPRASYVDIELRSVPALRAVLEAAENLKVGRILSVHEFNHTPGDEQLEQYATQARADRADIFKLAVRTDTRRDLERLVSFFESHHQRMKISAMGVGKCGRAARIALLGRGSVLNYGHLGVARVQGQLSLAEMRRVVASR